MKPRRRPPLVQRAIVALFPPRFRKLYGGQILQFARDARADGRSTSFVSLLGAVVAAWAAEARRLVGGRRPGLEHRAARSRWFATSVQDVRGAARYLRRQPLLALLVAPTLALAIGAAAGTGAVVESVLLRPLPFPDSDRLVMVWDQFRGINDDEVELTADQYQTYRQDPLFEAVAAYRRYNWNLTTGADPEPVTGVSATGSLFGVLRRAPALGRGFSPSEDLPGGPRVAVISDGLWSRRFGGRASALGESVALDGEPYTIVGVMPRGFGFPAEGVDVWVPARLGDTGGSQRIFEIVARLRDDVTSADTASWASRMTGHFVDAFGIPADYAAMYAVRIVSLHEQVVGRVRPALLAFFGSVCLLLLIAAANVAGLTVLRNDARRHEFAVRASMGAGRARIVRQVLTENTLLSVVGGVLGLGLAWLLLHVLPALDVSLPRATDVGLSATTIVVTVLGSAVIGAMFGAVPAWRVTGCDLRGVLTEGGPAGRGTGGQRPYRGLLVVVEIALATVLLVGAGLLVRSFINLQQVDLGFRPDGVLAADLYLPASRFPTGDDRVRFVDEALRAVVALPGVESAAIVSGLPLRSPGQRDSLTIEHRQKPAGEPPIHVELQLVSAGYFTTLAHDLRSGRLFTSNDTAATEPVAIVTETLARRFWPDGAAMGRRVALAGTRPRRWLTIVGVVGDVRAQNVAGPPADALFVPYVQAASSERSLPRRITLAVRGAGSGGDLVGIVSRAIRGVDSGTALADVALMRAVVDHALARPRLASWLVGAFAAVAVLLSALGVYGVVSHTAATRTREIGIRVALGARPRSVLRAVTARAAWLGASGLVLGVVAGAAAGPVLSRFLFGISAFDGTTLVVATAALMGVVALAAFVPARRACRIDPVRAMRHDG
ncbi:MAG TPA: ABC transporter permease [Vicinamibacterales bacterium]|nr:ABC transporter permease [Vicinamibacterales bacterium]